MSNQSLTFPCNSKAASKAVPTTALCKTTHVASCRRYACSYMQQQQQLCQEHSTGIDQTSRTAGTPFGVGARAKMVMHDVECTMYNTTVQELHCVGTCPLCKKPRASYAQHMSPSWRLLSMCACEASTGVLTGNNRHAGWWLAQPHREMSTAAYSMLHLNCSTILPSNSQPPHILLTPLHTFKPLITMRRQHKGAATL